VVRGIYAAINDNDPDAISPYLADDCIRRYPRGDSPIAGDHVGRDAVVDSYRYVLGHTDGDYKVDVGNVLANDVIASSYHREQGHRARDGAALDAEMIVRWVFRDGRVSEIWDYSNDIPSLNEFLR